MNVTVVLSYSVQNWCVCVHVRFFSELAGPLGPTETDQEPAVPSQPVEIEIETAEARHKRQKKCVFGK